MEHEQLRPIHIQRRSVRGLFSYASNLVVDDTNNERDVFLRDRVMGTTTRISEDSAVGELNGASEFFALSGDGRYVALGTGATNIVPDDINGYQDVVIRALPDLTVTAVTPDQLPIGETTAVTITGTNFLPGATPHLGDAQVSDVVIVDETTMTADVTIPSGAADGLQDVSVGLPGTGPGFTAGSMGTCAECVRFFVVNCGCGCP